MDGVIRVPFENGRDVLVAAAEMVPGPVLTGPSGTADDMTGKMVWAGAHDMCHFLNSAVGALLFHDKSVIELGIGAGLTTVVLSRLSPHVIGSDCNPEALALAAQTVSLNGSDDHVALVQYDWNHDEASTFVPFLSADRQIIIAATEIVYPSTETDSLDALFSSVNSISLLVSSDPHPFIMAYVQRRPETTLRMLTSAWKAGYTWEIIPWTKYSAAQSPMATLIMLFAKGSVDFTADEFEAALASSFPDLRRQVQAVRRAELEAEQEAAAFVLPFALEEDL